MDLTAEREYVADLLRALNLGQVYAYVPENTALPAFLIVPSDPYLTPGQTFNTARVGYQIAYVSTSGANSNNSLSCDQAVSAAVTTFITNQISIDGGSAPYAISMNGQQYVAQDLQVSFSIDL